MSIGKYGEMSSQTMLKLYALHGRRRLYERNDGSEPAGAESRLLAAAGRHRLVQPRLGGAADADRSACEAGAVCRWTIGVPWHRPGTHLQRCRSGVTST